MGKTYLRKLSSVLSKTVFVTNVIRVLQEGKIMIIKELKNVIFSYDEDKKTLLITKRPLGIGWEQYPLSRSETFSLARFLIRVFQKGKKRKVDYGGTARSTYRKGNKGGTLKRKDFKELYKSTLEL